MTTRTLFSAVLAAGALALVPLDTPSAEPQHVLNFGTAAPEGTPWADQLNGIAQRVKTETSGAVQINIFLGSTLGGELEMARDVRRGERLQGGGFSTSAVATALGLPILELPELPYLFQTNEEADAVLDDILWGPTSDALAGKGMVLAAWAENGWRSFATNGGAATTPAELAAYKMRAQETDSHLCMYEQLGAQAVTKPVTEVLPSLNTGIVDGFDNTPLFSLAAGWIGPVDHYTLSRHIYQPAAVVYSKRAWDKLSPDLQTTVLGDARAESQAGRQGVRTLEAELLQTIRDMGKTVVELSGDQRNTFASKTASCHQDYLSRNPDMKSVYDQVQAKLASMR